jgi:tetratricopeptide (TPR) repeat protein
MYHASSIATLKICFRLLEQTRDLCHDHLEQPAVTRAQYLLGVAYRANGHISKAVGTLEHVVKVREKLAEDHPDRLVSQHELARAYQADGQISKAVETLEHVVKVGEKLAEDHPRRLASQHTLAGAYHANGQISKAVETLEHVVKVKEKLAEDHPERLASQHALAGAYRANGHIAKAVELLKPVVLIKQRKFRVNHRSRTVSEDLLGSLISEVEKTPQQRARIPIRNDSGHETNRTKRRKLEDGTEEATT